MRDLLPDQVELRDHAAATIVAAYRRFGFQRVETPCVEHLELLAGSQGGENEKLMYKILKRGSKLDMAAAKTENDLVSSGLRFDLTVPLARFYAHNRGRLPQPFKSIQIGPVWRAERPQKGRYRQFTQCDIDILGDETVAAEIELLQATTVALADLGLQDFVVRINDRRLLIDLIAGCGFAAEAGPGVLISVDKLDKVGASGVVDELRAAGHPAAAVDRLGAWLADARPGGEEVLVRLAETVELSPEGRAAADRLRTLLSIAGAGVPGGGQCLLDPTLVRGMGYYTGPIFEVGLPGVSYSLAGGGRYDKLIGRMTGRDVPATGFSIGFERVLIELEQRGIKPARSEPLLALLHESGQDELSAVFRAAAALRGDGRAVSVLARRKKLGKQIDELTTQGFDAFCVFDADRSPGDQEVKPLGEPSGA